MSDQGTYSRYLLATNELLLEFAREAKQDADETRGTEEAGFNAGYLMGLHRAISLMQQQAVAFDLDLDEIGLASIDPVRDVT